MAVLSVTIPDAVVPRIREAFGHQDPNNPTVRIPATVADVQAAVKGYLKSRVIDFEIGEQADVTRLTKSGENWD
jgi:hypothetical protein